MKYIRIALMLFISQLLILSVLKREDIKTSITISRLRLDQLRVSILINSTMYESTDRLTVIRDLFGY